MLSGVGAFRRDATRRECLVRSVAITGGNSLI